MNSNAACIIVFALALTGGCRNKESTQSVQPGPVRAEQSSTAVSYAPEQSGCSASDQKLISTYSGAAVEALLAGNLQRLIDLSEQLDKKLSRGCQAELATTQPVRNNCSLEEKRIALTHYEHGLQAILNSDIPRMIEVLDDLEESLSEKCWLAVNYPQHPELRAACSSSELTFLAANAGPGRQALKALIFNTDMSPTLQLAQELDQELSPGCKTVWVRINAPPTPQPGPPRPTRGPVASFGGIEDHGGGTYVLPGAGACTPTGCMAF